MSGSLRGSVLPALTAAVLSLARAADPPRPLATPAGPKDGESAISLFQAWYAVKPNETGAGALVPSFVVEAAARRHAATGGPALNVSSVDAAAAPSVPTALGPADASGGWKPRAASLLGIAQTAGHGQGRTREGFISAWIWLRYVFGTVIFGGLYACTRSCLQCCLWASKPAVGPIKRSCAGICNQQAYRRWCQM
uniref:Uncharacterized protein n=1 Tax=Pyrodinium bahamense TaxID=73915 RepID=A0A7S0FDH2_9DINO